MAEDTNPTARVETAKPTDGAQIPNEDAGGFHYYSGGDVKELADTRVSNWLWGFWGIVLVGAVFLGLAYGALGPKSPGAVRPEAGSNAGRAKIQKDLDVRGSYPVSVINLAAIDLPPHVNLTSAIAAGEGIYQNKCFGCHGPNQDGNGANAASLNPKPRNLRDAPFMQSMSYQRINTSLHKGVPGTAMPRWEGTLSDGEIQEVIAYVWSLSLTSKQLEQAEGVTPADAAQNTGGSTQVSPKPITPAINGDPTAHTNTAPPSMSGSPTDVSAPAQPSSQTTGAGAQRVSPIPNNPANADGTGPNLPSPAPVAQPTPASSGPSGAGGPGATGAPAVTR
jgi:mono/diheme cytochrome c family protein